jgi:hypothetical protein
LDYRIFITLNFLNFFLFCSPTAMEYHRNGINPRYGHSMNDRAAIPSELDIFGNDDWRATPSAAVMQEVRPDLFSVLPPQIGQQTLAGSAGHGERETQDDLIRTLTYESAFVIEAPAPAVTAPTVERDVCSAPPIQQDAEASGAGSCRPHLDAADPGSHEVDTWHPAPHGEVVVSIERAASVAKLFGPLDDQELAPLAATLPPTDVLALFTTQRAEPPKRQIMSALTRREHHLVAMDSAYIPAQISVVT